MGFWTILPIKLQYEENLKDEFHKTFVDKNMKLVENMYSKTEPLAACAKEILNEMAKLSWASKEHSGAYVPVFSIGVKSELFDCKMDNTDIPKKICISAGYE